MSLTERAAEAQAHLDSLKLEVVKGTNSRWIEFHLDRLASAETQVALYGLALNSARLDEAFREAVRIALSPSHSTSQLVNGVVEARMVAARQWIRHNRANLGELDKQALIDLFFEF